jgi:hypothetical protein
MAYELLDPAEGGGRYEMLPPTKLPKDFNLKGEGYDRIVNYSGRDAVGGAVRGAGSIGATVIRPFESAEENAQRRTGMDQGLTTLVGSNPNSLAYQTNKLGAEVAGTLGLGGLVANSLRAIPGAAKVLPTLIPAIESAGMSANGAKGAYGLANRVAGGAVNGALTAGAVNPKDAGTGMLIGGATPAVTKTIGSGMTALGEALFPRPAAINPVLRETLEMGQQAGYVVPPNMVQPNFRNQVIESVAGKQATQQIASTKNTQVTEKLTRQALGIADDVPLSQGTLESLRKTAGRAYGEVSGLSPQAAADLEALKLARNEAQAWFKAYNRSASPTDLAKAKEARALSESLETALEGHAVAAQRPELIPALRDARKQIAKTYTVGRALNDAAGTVDARVYGRMYEKGMPQSDGLDVAGRFASAFPTVAKSPQQIGSPAAHNLKSMASMAMAGGGYAAMGPLGAASAVLPFVAPPAAQSIMFSQRAQRGLLDTPRVAAESPELGLLSLGAYRALPLVSGR